MNRKTKTEPFTEDESLVFLFAMRYALGRMSTSVEIVCQQISGNVRRLTDNVLECMLIDLNTEIGRDDRMREEGTTDMFILPLGMDCDRQDWLELRETIKAEIKRRKKANDKG